MSLGRRPMLALMPLAWLVIVVAVAGLTWQVIDSAGRHVLVSGGPPPLSDAGTTPKGVGRTGSAPQSPRHPEGPGSHVTHKPSTKSEGPTSPASPAPSAPETTPSPVRPSEPRGPSAGQQTAKPTPEPTAGPSQQPAQPEKPQTQQPSKQPSPATQVRSWQGAAGTVTAACTGARISLQSVTPNDGWEVEVGDRGPERIEVHFSSRGEDGRETHVTAACGGGVPRFHVDSDDD